MKIKKLMLMGIGVILFLSMIEQAPRVNAAENKINYNKRVQAEDFVSKTGNIYTRTGGDSVPIDSLGNDSVILTKADGGKFVDFSNPVDKYLNTDVIKDSDNIPVESITGDTATWNVNVPYSGVYKLSFKYNNPATRTNGYRNIRDERNCRVIINDKDGDFYNNDNGSWAGWMIFNTSGYNKEYDEKSNISLTPQTDDSYKNVVGNTEWNNNYMNVYLDKGFNTITLGIEAPPGQGVYDGPNIDYFDVTYIGDQYMSKDQIPYIDKNFKFQHPGIYYTIDDLKNMKANKDNLNTLYGLGYKEIKASELSSADYVPNPQELINVGPYNRPNFGGTEYTKDACAAHYNALRWYMDGDIANAKKAIEILNSWSNTLQTVADGNDLKLRFSLIGPDFLNTAEILKNIYNNDPTVPNEDKWKEADIQKFESFIRDKLLYKTKEYYPQANGNWDALIGAFNMAAAVYLEDVDLFNDALTQLYLGNIQGGYCSSMGSLPNYIYPSGESQESSRDQVHAQMGITGLAYQSDIAWNQGIDLYSAYDNRLLNGAIYNAKYNLGESVDSQTFISDKVRGAGANVFEILNNHYLNQVTTNNEEISYLSKAAETLSRKEGTVNEAKQSARYYGAMIFNDKKYEVSLDLTANTDILKNIGDKIVITANVNTDSEIKSVNWHIPEALKPYINYTVSGDGKIEIELVKTPDNNLTTEIIANTVKDATVSKSISISCNLN